MVKTLAALFGTAEVWVDPKIAAAGPVMVDRAHPMVKAGLLHPGLYVRTKQDLDRIANSMEAASKVGKLAG